MVGKPDSHGELDEVQACAVAKQYSITKFGGESSLGKSRGNDHASMRELYIIISQCAPIGDNEYCLHLRDK